jgi:hypothetical protein
MKTKLRHYRERRLHAQFLTPKSSGPLSESSFFAGEFAPGGQTSVGCENVSAHSKDGKQPVSISYDHMHEAAARDTRPTRQKLQTAMS